MNLYRQKIIELPKCAICLQEDETISHIFWECPSAIKVWGEPISPLNKWVIKPQEIRELWFEIMEKLPIKS